LADRVWRETDPVSPSRATSVFGGFRFPPEAISLAVRWYLRYGRLPRGVFADAGDLADQRVPLILYQGEQPSRSSALTRGGFRSGTRPS
jgi:hypothetical protein